MSLRRSHFLGTFVGVLATIFVSALVPSPARAATENEAKVKWLRAFAEYINWRQSDFADDRAPFVFGILGDNPFGKDIELLKSKPIQKRNVEVKLFKSVEEVAGCHILFISESERRTLAKTLKRLESQRILTVSDIDGFIKQGGVASIVVKQIGVEASTGIPDINKEALARGGWDVQPKLLAAIQSMSKYR